MAREVSHSYAGSWRSKSWRSLNSWRFVLDVAVSPLKFLKATLNTAEFASARMRTGGGLYNFGTSLARLCVAAKLEG